MGKEAPPGQVNGVAAWTEVKVWSLLGQKKEECAGQIPVWEGMSPGECSARQT